MLHCLTNWNRSVLFCIWKNTVNCKCVKVKLFKGANLQVFKNGIIFNEKTFTTFLFNVILSFAETKDPLKNCQNISTFRREKSNFKKFYFKKPCKI